MARVDGLIDGILRREGGFVNDPVDRGGATNMGITIDTLSQHLGRQATVAEVKGLTPDTARAIYKHRYYTQPQIDKLPEELQDFMLDASVHHGPNGGARLLQAALNRRGHKIKVDGRIGPATIAAAHATSDLLPDLVQVRKERFESIIAANPSQEKFRKGWMARLAEFGPGRDGAPVRTVEAPAPAIVGEEPAADVVGRFLQRAQARRLSPLVHGSVDPSRVVGIDTRLRVPPDLANDTGFMEQAASFLGRHNLVGIGTVAVQSALTASERFSDDTELTPDQVWEMLTPGERMDGGSYTGVTTAAELQKVRADKMFQDLLQQKIESGPVNAVVGTLVASILDPVNYVPFFGWARAGSAVVKAARVAGEIGVTESVAQALQENRSAADSLAAVILGGSVAGGVAAALARPQWAVKDLGGAIHATTQGTDELAGGSVGAQFSPVDAASVAAGQELTKAAPTALGATIGRLVDMAESISPAITSPVRAIERGVSRINPSWEILKGPFSEARNLLLHLTHPAVLTKGNLKGFANPEHLEGKVHMGRAIALSGSQELDAIYRKAKAAGYTASKRTFLSEVGRAGIHGRIPTDPHVREAWQFLNKAIYDPLVKKADSLKLWGDYEMKFRGAPRMLDIAKMRLHSKEFDEKVGDWIFRTYPNLMDDFDLADARKLAADIRAKYSGQPYDRLPTNIKVGDRARGKEVVADDIPWQVIEDFLVTDAEALMNRFVRTVYTDIHVKDKFGELNIEGTIEKLIRAEADTLKAATENLSKRKLLDQQAERQINLLKHIYRSVRGVQGPPTDPLFAGMVPVFSIARNYTFVKDMGSVLFSSLGGDVMMPVFQHGLKRALGTTIQEMVTGFKGTRLAKRDLNIHGDASDWANARHFNHLYDIGERWETDSRLQSVEKFSRSASGFYAKATLLPVWNDWMKAHASVSTTTRILEAAERVAAGKPLSKFDATQLARVGLGQRELAAIAKEEANWTREGLLIFANGDKWKDQEALRKFRQGMVDMARNTVLTPYAADAPMMFDREWGKTIFQFKRFAMAATGRILISGLQRRDMAAVNGILLLAAGGVLSTAMRDLSAHGEIKDRDLDQWIVEGVDRSGMLALFFEANTLSEKFAGLSLIGREIPRYAAKGRSGTVGGPVVSAIEGVADLTTRLGDGEFDARSAMQARRLAPFQNHFLINGWLNSLAE